MSKARYICIEGTEGVGKSTQTKILYDTLTAAGHRVLLTKEPGTPHSPLTMNLRGIMLDKQYDAELTPIARELVSQAIRSIHLEKVIYPAFDNYDYIIQDRGMLSGLSYGVSCGNDEGWIESLLNSVVGYNKNFHFLYDDVIYLKGNVSAGLDKAKNAKQEFKAGDAIEAKGLAFMNTVATNMDKYSHRFSGVKYITVDGKSIQQVTREIFESLDIGVLNDKKQD